MPELARPHRLRRRARGAHPRTAARARANRQSVRAAHGRAAHRRRRRSARRRRAPARQAHRRSRSRASCFLVLHLMIAGRLRWLERDARSRRRGSRSRRSISPNGTLAFTEAGTKRRASLHFVAGEAALATLRCRRAGRSLTSTSRAFAARLASENHTLKRALTDPRLFAGIGNAYSDEILHRARLSPIAHTAQARRRRDRRGSSPRRAPCSPNGSSGCATQAGGAFPEKVTAFGPRWPCTADSASRARSAARRCSASSTPRTNATTARAARPAACPRRSRAVAAPAQELAALDRRAHVRRAACVPRERRWR